MIKLDEHKEAGLALVANDDLTEVKYIPLEDASEFVCKAISIVHLKQAHYCARITTQGLFISTEQPMLPGWKKYDAQIALLNAMSRKNAYN